MASDNSSAGTETVMIPYLHFAGGDSLIFKSIQPSSKGAIAGACLVLVVLALLDRWLAATRGALEATWRRRALAIVSGRSENQRDDSSEEAEKAAGVKTEIQAVSRASSSSTRSPRTNRMIAPFIASHDIPRGLIHALQALLTYILMLAVMTFQAAYLISIVAGLGVGELLFGRMGSVAHVH